MAVIAGCDARDPDLPEIDPVDPLEFRGILSGWWDSGPSSEMDVFCGPDRNLHRHVFSDDGETVTWEFQRPIKGDRDGARSYTYRIVGASSVGLTMYIADESQKKDNGELWLWELVVVDNSMYRWRAVSFPTGVYNNVVGQRCDRLG